jgi:tetratricopeptide (TPR) repeat protein
LSERAKIYFDGEAPHLRIEALYHGFTVQPEAAEQECAMLYDEWNGIGRYEELLGLGVVLDELLAAGLPGGAVRSSVIYQLANIRYNYQPRSVTVDQAREALAEAQRSGVLWRVAIANNLLGDVLCDLASLPGALEAYRASLAIRQRLAAQDPANAVWQRELSVSQDNVASVLHYQGDLPGALEAYRASLAIAQRLAAQDPTNARWQRELSVSQEKVSSVLRVFAR